MVKKIIHLADLHIRTYKMHKEYKEVFSDTLTEITEEVKNLKREEIRIVIAGDLVHQKITISNELLMLSTWFLTELQKIGKVVLIAGNHDLLENNKDRLDSISPMIQLLSTLEIDYLKESKCYVDDNIVWSVYSIFEENKKPEIEISKVDNEDKLHVGLFHAPIIGLTTDIGYEFESGAKLEEFDGCDLVLCGDIHKRQILNKLETKESVNLSELDKLKGWKVNGDKSNRVVKVAMPGSLIQQNFGESIRKHGFLSWDVSNQSNITYTEHDVETNFGFYQFKIDSIEDIINGTEKLTNG